MTRRAFITGSHAYGTPGPNSDVDVVIYCDTDANRRLKSASSTEQFILLGNKINVIACTEGRVYDAWKEGTEECVKLAPIDKVKAKKIFDAIREREGIDDEYFSI